jgi:ketosteroid isomerase-like protein
MAARTPEDCDRLFAEHLNAGELGAVVALYEEGATYVLRDGVAAGPEAIRPVIERLIAGKPHLACHVGRVVRCGTGLALLYNDWTFSSPGPDGAPVVRTGRALELVRRQADGTWRFLIDDPHGRS